MWSREPDSKSAFHSRHLYTNTVLRERKKCAMLRYEARFSLFDGFSEISHLVPGVIFHACEANEVPLPVASMCCTSSKRLSAATSSCST